MKLSLILALSGCFLLSACQPSTTQPPPVPTKTGLPALEVSPTPSLISPTETPLPAPTETPVPAPRTFTESFDAAAGNWSFMQVDNGQPASKPAVTSGFLVFDLSAPDQWLYMTYDPQEYGDVRVDARAGVLSGSDGAAGVVCRYSATDGWYEFNVYSDQTFTLMFGQWLAEGVARYRPMYRGSSDKIKSDVNEIGLSCEGDVLTPFVNGVQLRKWQDTRYGLKSGRVGLSVSSFETTPWMIGFDWVRVSEP